MIRLIDPCQAHEVEFDPGLCELKICTLNHYATMPSYFRHSDYIKVVTMDLCGVGPKELFISRILGNCRLLCSSVASLVWNPSI